MAGSALAVTAEDRRWDVFLSYAHKDGKVAALFYDALVDAGLTVWRDVREIRPLDMIDAELRAGIQRSRLTVVLGSSAHFESPVCRWECLYSIAEGAGSGADRLALVLLEPVLHLYPLERVRATLELTGGGDNAAEVAMAVATHLASLPTAAADRESPPALVPAPSLPGTAGERFTGRLDAITKVHGVLFGQMRALDTGRLVPSRVAVVRGMGGVGKSLLALFYGEQFHRAFSLGVLWLNAVGDQVDHIVGTSDDRTRVFSALSQSGREWLDARAIAKGQPGLKETDLPEDAESRWGLLRELLVSGVDEYPDGRLLVVVDDLPEGVRGARVIPVHDRIDVIVTTRNALLGDQGYTLVDLNEFAPEESMLLLTNAVDPNRERRRRGEDPWDGGGDTAADLVGSLGHHPMAVDLVATRLRDHEPVGEVAHEIAELTASFLDADDVDAQLPTEHTPSILATIASSLRSACKTGVADVPRALRAISVVPAATSIPSGLFEGVIPGNRHDGGGRVQRLLVKRSVIRSSAAGDAVTCHVLTRSVARHLWDAGKPPFENELGIEPAVTFGVARWFHTEGRSRRNKDDVGAAAQYRTCLDVLDEAPAEFGAEQAVQRCESFVGQARVVYRLPTDRGLTDLNRALRWVEDGQRAVEPHRASDPRADWAWYGAEAMRGLLLGETFRPDVRPDASDEERLAGREAALAVCVQADDGREWLANRLRDLADPPIAVIELETTLAQSRYNLPGRKLEVAKGLVSCLGSDAFERARTLLYDASTTHQQVIESRHRLWPEPTGGQWLSIAASHAGRGTICYYRAVLLRDPPAVRAADLDEALQHAHESLLIRRDSGAHEPDVTKSLGLVVKVALARLAAGGEHPDRSLQSWARDQADRARAEAEPFRGQSYEPGRPGAEATATPVQAYRDTRSSVFDALAAVPDSGGAPELRALAVAAMEWMAVAEACGQHAESLARVLTDLFDPPAAELAGLLTA